MKRIIRLIDKEGNVLFENRLTALSLKEESIIQKSIEYYSDPEPCMIHRSAVMKSIYMQIYEFLQCRSLEGIEKILLNELPKQIRECLVLGYEAQYLIMNIKK